MKIQVEIDVFDDSDLCTENTQWFQYDRCERYDHENQRCNHFNSDLDDVIIYDTDPIIDGTYIRKCDQCKAVYQKAKEFENAKGKF